MEIEGKVVSLEKNIDIEKQDGSTYKGTVLTYSYGGKIEQQKWHNNALKYNKNIVGVLGVLEQGNFFRMTKEKNDKGYWNVSTLCKIESLSGGNGGGNSSPTPSSVGRDSNTQVYIIRQNSVTNAINYLGSVVGNEEASVEDILSIASRLEKFILDGKVELAKPSKEKGNSPQEDDDDDLDEIPF